MYTCVKSFLLDAYNDSGNCVEENAITINMGDKFEITDDKLQIASSLAIKLISTNKYPNVWIEIYPEDLNEYFKKED